MAVKDAVYLRAFKLIGEAEEADPNGGIVAMPIETYIVLFVAEYCEIKNVEFKFIITHQQDSSAVLSIPQEETSSLNLHLDNITPSDLPQEIKDCSLPAVWSSEKRVCVGGLCAVLRWVIKSEMAKLSTKPPFAHLLGFRNGCLMACSEVSIWTKFCEIDLPNATFNFIQSLRNVTGASIIVPPEELLRFESHMSQPVKTHNILKRKQDILGKKGLSKDSSADRTEDLLAINSDALALQQKSKPCCKDDIYGDLEHTYAEGVDMTLADIILFPCIHIIMTKLGIDMKPIHEKVPLVMKWYSRLLNNTMIARTIATFEVFSLIKENRQDPASVEVDFLVPQLESLSLYIRDPTRKKTKVRNYEPDSIIEKIQTVIAHPYFESNSLEETRLIDWDSLPSSVHPAGGDLPCSRVSRKCQQLQNIISAVISLAPSNSTIVDFCSGSGHCGILLAYLLPDCRVILIENKESSMDRARKRAAELGLPNLCFYQCNLDYFQGSFDIGISLHACGVSTDLVIEKCLKHKASFVCSPCCYGSIHNNHVLRYPRSERLKSTGITYQEYLMLCHCADRTEFAIKKAEQGKFCMGLIDTDRLLCIQEAGYEVKLYTMNPPSCSPKNNILVGHPKHPSLS